MTDTSSITDTLVDLLPVIVIVSVFGMIRKIRWSHSQIIALVVIPTTICRAV